MVFSVLAVGDANVDIVFTGLKTLPQSEQDVLAQGLEILVGGQTSTFARALSRLGLQVTFVGKVGKDADGQRVIEQLQQDGVDTSGVIIDPGLRTGVTVILSTGSERAYATYIGSICEVSRSDIPIAFLLNANHIHVGSYFLQTNLQPELADLFREAHRLGLTTSLDPGWNTFGKWEKDILDVLNYVDVFLPNEVEAAYITRTVTPEEALEILGGYADVVVIKGGKKGCLAKDKKGVLHSPAFDVPVVDVTSAGDVFNAGFIYAYLNGWELERAARFANACGAIAVTKVGSSGIYLSLREVEEMLLYNDPERK